MFFVQAIARDGGTPARKSETIVTINVEESNNKPPKFRMVSTLLSDLLDSSSICQKSHVFFTTMDLFKILVFPMFAF